jgi:amino-acid N-acetyltransferase
MTADVAIARADAPDLTGVLALLARHHLPQDGLRELLDTTIVARRGTEIVGSAAVELYPDGALLRSVAVSPELQGRGWGRKLVETAIQLARDRRAPALYLLTTTADRYFPKLGFEPIERAALPPGVRTSVEFTSACPSTAIAMRKSIDSKSRARAT